MASRASTISAGGDEFGKLPPLAKPARLSHPDPVHRATPMDEGDCDGSYQATTGSLSVVAARLGLVDVGVEGTGFETAGSQAPFVKCPGTQFVVTLLSMTGLPLTSRAREAFVAPAPAVRAQDVPLQRKTCLLYTSPSPRDRQKSRM